MNKKITWLTLFIVSLCFITVFTQQTDEEELKVGGWQQIQLKEMKQYWGALNFLKEKGDTIPENSHLLKVESQVVAGTNFKFTFQINSVQHKIVVWQKLDGGFEMMSHAQVDVEDL